MPGCQVVHVRLEVLDDAALIGRGEVGAGMGEGHCADGAVVCLEDGFKVEGEAVPECKLSAGRACKHPATLGCPLRWALLGYHDTGRQGVTTYHDNVYWTSYFVRGGVHELGAKGRGGIIGVCFWRKQLD